MSRFNHSASDIFLMRGCRGQIRTKPRAMMARRKEQKQKTGRIFPACFAFDINMKTDKNITMKEVVYNKSGKSLTEIIKESFLNFYFLRQRQH